MIGLNFFGTFKVGNGSGNFQNPVILLRPAAAGLRRDKYARLALRSNQSEGGTLK